MACKYHYNTLLSGEIVRPREGQEEKRAGQHERGGCGGEVEAGGGGAGLRPSRPPAFP